MLRLKLASEALGTGMLVVAVVGSGIMGERLSSGISAIALLANSLATGAALFALISVFAPISGAHFNPVVTLSDAWRGGLAWQHVPGYIGAQIFGALCGVALANMMFALPPFSASTHVRSGGSLLLSETFATFGLLATIWGCTKVRSNFSPFAVAAYITGAYWFTSSTSFANPAVTLARAATDTFSGIRPVDVPAFIGAQLIGAALATLLFQWLHKAVPPAARVAVIRQAVEESYEK
jgi:glycerol uptake facilitator-like aquaporin